MYFNCFIAILLALFFAPIKSYATAFADEEMPDYLIYNGKKYTLEDDILQPCLKIKNKWRDDNKWQLKWKEEILWCTALTDYYAIYEIVGNELILKDIRDSTKKSILKEFLSIFAAKDSIFKLDWFADSIVIGEDEPLYEGIHEYYSVLHFEKGKLIKDTSMSYKEYLSNRLKKRLKKFSDADYYIKALFGNRAKSEYKNDLETIDFYLETKKGDKSEFLTELKTKYEKKFGKPMSDFELKIQRISYFDRKYDIEITRTPYGAATSHSGKNPREDIDARLSIEEWLDIIKDLYTCCLDKWERVPRPTNANTNNKYKRWAGGTFYVYTSSSHPYSEYYTFPIKYQFKVKPPNLEEFEKVMEKIIAKIRKNSVKP